MAKAGAYAAKFSRVFDHIDTHLGEALTGIGDCARHLYRDWLPESGEDLRDFPLYFHYLNLITETPEHELMPDIYLPLK